METKSKKNTVKEINNENSKMAEFLKKRQEAAENLKVEKETRKATRKSRERKLGKEDTVVMDIFNAGNEGILFEELLTLNAERGEKKASEITINHNWNREEVLQRGEEKLRTPEVLNPDTKREGIEVYFDIEFNKDTRKDGKKGNNNRITLMEFCKETLREYLISHGAKAEWLNQ